MKRILIVDDEAPARERLGRLLVAGGASVQVDYAVNGFEALAKIKLLPPDILFLDIQMPGMTGFEVLQNLEKRDFQVIFQTAYDQFAIRAFEESACDYLLKPFEAERLNKAVDRALAGIVARGQIERLESALKSSSNHLQKIAISQGNKAFQLSVDDVVCFTSQDHYTRIFTGDKDYVTDLSLTHLEERLDPERFFRCHRSHIVAVPHVASLQKGPRMTVRFANDMEIEVSRQNRARMRELIEN